MSSIDTAYDENIESASGLIQPTDNNTIDLQHQLRSAGFETHSKPSDVRKGNGLLDIDFCHNGSSIPTTIGSINSASGEHKLQSSRLPSPTKASNVRVVSQWIVDHQIGLSVNLFALVLLTHICFPEARTQTSKFFKLSYYNPDTGNYGLGPNDAWMVVFWVVVFTGLRAVVMDYALLPFSKMAGVKKERDQARFCEQAWLLVYYSVFWTLGMYILVTSDYWLKLENMWTNFPNREIDAVLKWYTLAQYAFWVQQFLVLHIEKPRKDHWQMFAHHVVTTLLIFCSYCYHQTRVANLILCIMDVVDLFFPTAKCLKYAGYNVLCDIMFGLFMVVWVAARHIIFMMATYSVYAHSDTASPPGCYKGKMGSITGPFPPPDRFGHLLEPFTNPEGLVCWTGPVKWGFVDSLLFLQVLTLIWFSMIVKVAIKVLKGGQADDTRSDDENESENEDEQIETKSKKGKSSAPTEPSPSVIRLEPFEEEVGVESLNLRNRTLVSSENRHRKSAGHASGASIANKKQLLDRIGCDKKTSD